MTEIGPRSFNIAGRMIILIVLFLLIGYNLYLAIKGIGIGGNLTSATLFGGIFFAYILQLRLLPFGVIIDEQGKQLSVKYLFRFPRIVSLHQMNAYYNVSIRSKSGNRYGIVLLFEKEKQLLFSELSLENYEQVQAFLDSLKVKHIGQQNFSFTLYYLNQ